jgi:hypothetical protein
MTLTERGHGHAPHVENCGGVGSCLCLQVDLHLCAFVRMCVHVCV